VNRRIVALAFVVVALPLAATARSPYAGQEARTIKTLSAEEIRGYLAGDGLGYAKAGELNHYPGPKHVLAGAQRLGITSDQRSRIEQIASAMTARAIPLGRQIIAAEAELNNAFAHRAIGEAGLQREVMRIAELQGRLRAVHLTAHLATRSVLTAQQVALYDELRGYGGPGTAPAHAHHM
jgi:hypothetical protein